MEGARITLKYRDSQGVLSEREVSRIERNERHEGDAFTAFCHLRGGDRTFRLSRIESAWDSETGEVIDLYDLLVVPRPVKPAPRPIVTAPPHPKDAKARRNKDKYELYKPFFFPVIAALAKSRLLDLFGRRCFRCDGAQDLVIDHHIPQVLGGRLMAGNLVVLCRACNGVKRARDPGDFYEAGKLELLADLLAKQPEIFTFKFDWDRWREDRERYLLDLGVPPITVRAVLYDEDHPHFVGLPGPQMGVVISVKL